MKKTSILETLKWLFLASIAAYLFGYSTVFALDLIFIIPQGLYQAIPTLLIVLIFGHFFYRILARLDNHLPVKEKRELKATNARSIMVNGNHRMLLSSVTSIFSSQAPQSPESVLWWRYGNHIIYEDYALEWLRKGWKRQNNLEPHPYSGNWMVRQRFTSLSNQTIDRDYHDATCLLLSDYQLWRKEPVQGASGKAMYSPLTSLAKLRGQW